MTECCVGDTFKWFIVNLLVFCGPPWLSCDFSVLFSWVQMGKWCCRGGPGSPLSAGLSCSIWSLPSTPGSGSAPFIQPCWARASQGECPAVFSDLFHEALAHGADTGRGIVCRSLEPEGILASCPPLHFIAERTEIEWPAPILGAGGSIPLPLFSSQSCHVW